MSILSKSGIPSVSNEAKYKESGQAKTFFFLPSKLGGASVEMEHCKWKKHSRATRSGVPDENKVSAQRIFDQFRFMRYFTWALPLCLCPSCSMGSAPHYWLPALEGQMQSHGTLTGKVYFSADSNIAQGWSSGSSLLCGNISWKAYQPFPRTEETTERRVWGALMRSLETPKVLSKTCSSVLRIQSHSEAGLFLGTLQGNHPAYTFSPPSCWSPESADRLAMTRNRNQIVRSHAWASKKLQRKEKE